MQEDSYSSRKSTIQTATRLQINDSDSHQAPERLGRILEDSGYDPGIQQAPGRLGRMQEDSYF